MNTLDTWHASEELIQPTTETRTPTPIPRMKPRRSRASKKKPTTVLKANPNNFRALVQQFTGRPSPSSASAATLFGALRGPINLSFSNYHALPPPPPPPPPPLQLSVHKYSHHQGISSAAVFSSFLDEDDDGFESGSGLIAMNEEFPAAMDDLLTLPELRVSEAFYYS